MGAEIELIIMPMGQVQTFEGHSVNSNWYVDITCPGPHTQDLVASYVARPNEWRL